MGPSSEEAWSLLMGKGGEELKHSEYIQYNLSGIFLLLYNVLRMKVRQRQVS